MVVKVILILIIFGVIGLLFDLIKSKTSSRYRENKKFQKDINSIGKNKEYELIELCNRYKRNLDSYMEQLKFTLISSEHINNITNLIHSYILVNWLLKNEKRGTFEKAKEILEIFEFEQKKAIHNLKSFLQNKLLEQSFTLQELRNIQEEALQLATKQIEGIYKDLPLFKKND